ncbi:hypothetical protein VTI28DRAFT_7380 [Corynascus sepedonium]
MDGSRIVHHVDDPTERRPTVTRRTAHLYALIHRTLASPIGKFSCAVHWCPYAEEKNNTLPAATSVQPDLAHGSSRLRGSSTVTARMLPIE